MASSQQLLDSLKQIGFTPNEAEVYAALVKLSPTFVAPLVKSTGKHRQMVYNALESLQERNLIVRTVKNGKFFYEIGSPDRLVQMIKEQERVAQDLAADLAAQISQPVEQIEVLRGSQAIQEANLAFTDIGRQNGEYIIMNTIPKEFLSFTGNNLQRQLDGLRQLRHDGIPVLLLAFGSVEEQLHLPSMWPSIDDPYETRVSSATPEPPQTIWIAGDHVYLRNHLADPILIHIVSQDLSRHYHDYFRSYWEAATPLHRLSAP